MKTHYLLLLMIATMFITKLHGQSLYKQSNSKENVIKISGKSNVHDWTMVAQNPICEADFTLTAGNEKTIKSLNSLSFSVNAKDLKSEHESMDKRAFKTIKGDSHPKITFKLSNATVTPLQNNKVTIKATGTLNIAGVSKVITMLVNGEVKPDNTITCTGQEKIKLTEYSVEPPSFMLGAMKVGNDLTIQYTLNFTK